MSVNTDDVLALDTWLLCDGVKLELAALLEGLAHRLRALGLPLDRFSASFGLLNPSLLAASIIWRPGTEMEFTRFDYAKRDSGMYERSPLKVAHESGEWVFLNLSETPDDLYGVVPELKAEGLVHYVAVPAPDSRAKIMSITLATKDPQGFSEDHCAIVRKMLPALTAVLEIKTLQSTFRDVLAAYVGREPATQIMAGTVHRGQVTGVRAAILVADLRGFTYLSTQLPPEATADVINRYYDVVVPHIHERGGEVLKFIGDAVLAIFPTAGRGDEGAALAALEAARAALDEEVPPFVADGRHFDIRFGIALHIGDAVFGNVGSGDRLDFTVIGRDVNIAARIASLCSRLGRDYLVSSQIAGIGRRSGMTMADAGSHDVRGLDRPLQVFVPDAYALEPEHDDGISQGLAFAPAT